MPKQTSGYPSNFDITAVTIRQITNDLNIGGDTTIQGFLQVNYPENATGADTGAIRANGGIYSNAKCYIAGETTFAGGTPSTSPTTGTVIVGGGIGVGSTIAMGQDLYFKNTTVSGYSGTALSYYEDYTLTADMLNTNDNSTLVANVKFKIQAIGNRSGNVLVTLYWPLTTGDFSVKNGRFKLAAGTIPTRLTPDTQTHYGNCVIVSTIHYLTVQGDGTVTWGASSQTGAFTDLRPGSCTWCTTDT
jgi:hypothetical protein